METAQKDAETSETNVSEGLEDGRTVRNAKIIDLVAVDRMTQAEIGERMGLSQQRVSQIKQESRDLIRERQDDLRLRALDRIDKVWEPMFDGLGEAAQDPENRNQAQAARVVGEYIGLIGKGATHFGDNHLHLNAASGGPDARAVVIPMNAEERDARLAVLRERLS